MSGGAKKLLHAAAGTAAASGGNVYIEDVFSTHLFTGTGSSNDIDNGVDLDDKGGLVWIKARNNARGHALFDTERGANLLASNTTAGQYSSSGMTANSDGFTVVDNSVNKVNETIASWTFAKQEGFFDVVKFSTTGGGGTQAISHNLGSSPGLIIIKKTSATQSWLVWKKDITQAQCNNGSTTWWRNYGVLDATSAFTDWGDTSGLASEPSSTAVTVGTYYTNATADYIMYVFAEGGSDDQIFGDDGDEPIIKTGTYNGDNTTDGSAIIDLGFEPQWVMVKRTEGSGHWIILDNMRGISKESADASLVANGGTTENGTLGAASLISLTATGFALNSTSINANSQSYLYMAIRRGPMKEPDAGTAVFNGVLTNSDTSGFTGFPVSMGFPVDLALVIYTTLAAGRLIVDRLRGLAPNEQPSIGMIRPNAPHAQANTGELWAADSMTGYKIYGHNYQRICYGFRRYPKVFDEIAYTGTGSGANHKHNLNAVPEMVIIKKTDDSKNWAVYTAATGNSNTGTLNSTGIFEDNSAGMANTPTATELDFPNSNETNASGSDYVAYLFATLAGISKVGSYSGTGNDVNVACGFSGGARFVMIKRTDATGDWYVYDSIRGIIAGNDPYSTMNTTDVQVSDTDYIDPLASGFTVTSSAPAALNASGGTYIFLAIA